MRIEKKTNGGEVTSHHVRLSFGDSVLERRRPGRVQKGYFTGTVHSGSTQERRYFRPRAPRVRGRSFCLASPLVRDGEGQAGFGQREASPGDAAGRGQPGVRHPRQHRHEVCGRERGKRERRPVPPPRGHLWAPYSPVRLSSEPTSSELR